MEGNKKKNYDEYSSEHPIVRTHPETGKKILFVNWTYTKKIIGLDEREDFCLIKFSCMKAAKFCLWISKSYYCLNRP